MTEIKVEKGIPVPEDGGLGRPRLNKYGFHELEFEVNDSILVKDRKLVKAFLSHAFARAKRSNSGHKYMSRKVGDNQWRIWRIK
jgi:hypothetical protein